MTRRQYRKPPATQLDAWKRALADHRKQQRRDRWKRPPKPITGIIRMPGTEGEAMTTPRAIVAKEQSECAREGCDKPILVGQTVISYPGSGGLRHVECRER